MGGRVAKEVTMAWLHRDSRDSRDLPKPLSSCARPYLMHRSRPARGARSFPDLLLYSPTPGHASEGSPSFISPSLMKEIDFVTELTCFSWYLPPASAKYLPRSSSM